ncbi:MAG: biopolymer transporter ExbD [Acidobacteriota bacterium]|nr:biopolymer transporter ExbD [Acidobacteriota bacterium]
MKRLRRCSPDSSIPTSSMADIAFLLIIFFMVTTVFATTRGLSYRLPDTPNDPVAPDPAVLVHVFEDRVVVDCAEMTVEEMMAYLEPRLTRRPNKPVILYADGDASYQDLVTVYDALSGAGAPGSPWKFQVLDLSIPTVSEIEGYIETFGTNPLEMSCP